jgi:2'-5' RNA ligase
MPAVMLQYVNAMRSGRFAATAGLPVAACPFPATGTDEERALAQYWVRGYLTRTPATTDTDDTVHTGAMVALVPTPADAARLALDGAETVADLHVTLRYLGTAADIEDTTRQAVIAAVRSIAARTAPIAGSAWATATFNPGTDDTALVYLIGGDGLTDVHAAIAAAVAKAMPDAPTAHTPWVAHLTAMYTSDTDLTTEMEPNLGPVTLDRLRVASGPDITDFPLTGKAVTAAAPSRPAGLRRDLTRWETAAAVDFPAVQKAWSTAKQALLDGWPAIAAPVVEALAAAATAAAAGGSLTGLTVLSVPAAVIAAVAAALGRAMKALAGLAASAVVQEARTQGVRITAPDDPGRDRIDDLADATAGLLVNGYASAAVRAVWQYATEDPDVDDLGVRVRARLDDITTAAGGMVADQLGAALSAAQHEGRVAAFDATPDDVPMRLMASEVLDANTCEPCLDIDQKIFDSVQEAKNTYRSGGYNGCLGGLRCRGILVARWGDEEPETLEDLKKVG